MNGEDINSAKGGILKKCLLFVLSLCLTLLLHESAAFAGNGCGGLGYSLEHASCTVIGYHYGGTVRTITTRICVGPIAYSAWDPQGCGCYSGYVYNGSSCVPSCTTASSSESASCSAAGYQTGSMSRSVTTNSCTGTTYGGWDTSGCGCSSGYSWNGSSCIQNCSTSNTTESASCSGAGYQTGSMTRSVSTNSCTGTTYGGWNTGGCGCSSGYYWNGSSCAQSCTNSSYTETSSCGGGYQTGSMSRTVTTNSCGGTSYGSWNTGSCGCYSGYYWNGSSCTPSCSSSSSTQSASCSSAGYQTGNMTRSVTYNSCGGTSYGSWNQSSCGCYSGYSWNGSTCVADAVPENGACGSSLNSCASGSFSDVADSASAFLWNCHGIAGGSSTGCSQIRPGQCGSANNGTYSSSPHSSSALCALGTSSAVSGTGPWTWTCSTASGSASCSSGYCAPPVTGSCNNAIVNGCSAGDLVDLTDNSTDYLWQCKGLNGGPDSPQCSKAKPSSLAGSCGNSINTCNAGSFSDTADDTTNFNWQCLGSNGGASVNCTQAKTEAACSINGKRAIDVYFLADNTGSMGGAIATVNAKAQDILNRLKGGDARFANVDVNYAVGRYLGDPSEGQQRMCPDDASVMIVSQGGAQGCVKNNQIVLPENVDSYRLFQSMTSDSEAIKTAFSKWKAFQGGDTPEGQFYVMKQLAGNTTGWRPNAGHVLIWIGDAYGHEETVTLNQAVQALQIANVTVIAMPMDPSSSNSINRNSQSTTIAANTNGSSVDFTGSNDQIADKIVNAIATSADKICPAATPPSVNGSCGASVNTCDSGGFNDTADSTGNFKWQCLGSGGGSSVNCSQAKPPEPITGSCGSSNNSCNSGSLNDTSDSAVEYKWQCLGSNGGSSANCATAKPVYPVNGSCGSGLNSCNAGSFSDTADSSSYYTWNCTGENGGSTASCSSAKPLPAINGSCGSSNNSCNAGSLSDAPDTATDYLWNCIGSNGGSSTGCSQAKPLPVVHGSCGSGNNSCNSGSLSDTADSSSNYLWNCVGSNGGSTASCSENKPLPPGCAADGFTTSDSLDWDGEVGSGYRMCDEVYGACPFSLDGVSCCSRATSTQAWTRRKCM